MKVEQGTDHGYWLDEGTPPFGSIVVCLGFGFTSFQLLKTNEVLNLKFQELIQYYETHNMQESFQALNTTLKLPLKAAVIGQVC